MRAIILVIILVLIVYGAVQLFANTKGDHLSESSLETTIGGDNGFKIKQALKYITTSEQLQDGLVKSESQIVSPVGAQISIQTASADNVTVRNVWQDGDKTYVVLAPVGKSEDRK